MSLQVCAVHRQRLMGLEMGENTVLALYKTLSLSLSLSRPSNVACTGRLNENDRYSRPNSF